VGDLSLYLISNGMTVDDLRVRGDSISFPQSVVDLVSGKLGQPWGQDGWPRELVRMVLKGEEPSTSRPGSLLEPVDLEQVLNAIDAVPDREVKASDALSKVLYPKVFDEYLEHRAFYGDVSVIPSMAFFCGLHKEQEIGVTIEPGKTLSVKLVTISAINEQGMRRVFFELNGMPRSVDVFDRSSGKTLQENEKADPANPAHIPAPLPATLVSLRVKEGEHLRKDQPLCTLEAMKMETTVLSPFDGVVEKILLGEGAKTRSGDLLMIILHTEKAE
jgi:pyruvate carboxylase